MPELPDIIGYIEAYGECVEASAEVVEAGSGVAYFAGEVEIAVGVAGNARAVFAREAVGEGKVVEIIAEHYGRRGNILREG